MNSLLSNLKGYKKECILAPLFKMLEAVLELLVPLIVAEIIDNGIANNDIPYIVKMGLVLVAFAVIGILFSITAQYFSAKAAVGFGTKQRQAFFDHVQSLSYSQIDKLGSSTLINRLTSDMNQVQNTVNMFLRLFLRSPFIVFGVMIMAFTIDAGSALIFVVAIPILAIATFGLILSCIPLSKKVQGNLDRVLKDTRQNLTGVRVIRAFNKEDEEIENFEKNNLELNKMQMLVGKISALLNPVTYVLINVATMVILWIGGVKVDGGNLTQGEVVALVNYMAQILVELIKLANMIILITKAIACQKRIQSVFDIQIEEEIEGNTSNKQNSHLIEFKDVSFTYQDASESALECVNFFADEGETIGIIGGTGTGKSTLVNLIPRFYKNTSGEILINGNDISNFTNEQLINNISIVPQKASLFKGTIADNLRFGKEDASIKEMDEALRISQAKEFVDKKGLNAEVEQGGTNFSGGQKQRLTIARAIIKKPKILILDDSASALDFATDLKLRQAISNMENKPTTFIVSQRVSSIQFADKILVLDDGKVVGQGKHEELLNSCPVYQEIYQSQIKVNGGACNG